LASVKGIFLIERALAYPSSRLSDQGILWRFFPLVCCIDALAALKDCQNEHNRGVFDHQ